MSVNEIKQSQFKVTRGKRKSYLLPKKELAIRVWPTKASGYTTYHNFESAKEAKKFVRNQRGRSHRVRIYLRRRK